jgi:hypothetical protein
MLEENEIVEEVVEQETVEQVEQQPEQTEEQKQQAEVQQKQQQEQAQIQENMRALREAKIEAERREEALLRRLEAIERNQRPIEPEEDLNFVIAPDDIGTGAHLLKVDKRIKKIEQQYEERLRKVEERADQVAAEAQLRMQYPDIDQVINPATVQAFNEAEPELAQAIGSYTDFRKRSIAAYKAIKRSGILSNPEEIQTQKQLLTNAQKPRSTSSLSPQRAASPLDQANMYANGRLTREMKEAARRRHYEIMGRR